MGCHFPKKMLYSATLELIKRICNWVTRLLLQSRKVFKEIFGGKYLKGAFLRYRLVAAFFEKTMS